MSVALVTILTFAMNATRSPLEISADKWNNQVEKGRLP
jgi:hypothetical protein